MGQRSDEIIEEGDSDRNETTAAARVEIEHTRADMTSTIEAIQERLDPEVLSEQAKDTAHDVTDYAIREAKEAAREITDHVMTQVRDVTGQAKLALRDATLGKVEHMARSATDTAGGWRQSVMETVKANPMPAALVGLGVGWMLLNRPSGSTGQRSGSSYYDREYSTRGYNPDAYGRSARPAGSDAGAATRVGQTAGRVVDQVQGTAASVVDQVQDTTGQVMDQVQETGGQVVEQVQRAQTFLQRQLDENPLLVGAVALAIGGALAGSVPSTAGEDQLLGETRDRFMGSAKELTQDTMDKVGKVVDEAQTAAKQEARDQSLVPPKSGN
ncbi:MAG: DUF3618 domain-containing protein [Chloroflexota bacterium]